MKLFVDSSGWISLFAKADKYHQPAASAFKTLELQPVQLFTSDYVLDETLTHIGRFYGRQRAIQFGRWVLSNSIVIVLYMDEAWWQAAWEMFQRYHDKEWAFTDCTSFVLMRQMGLYQAFTFDHHFAQAGFQLWPAQQE